MTNRAGIDVSRYNPVERVLIDRVAAECFLHYDVISPETGYAAALAAIETIRADGRARMYIEEDK